MYARGIALLCCISLSACTTSHWVTASRQEVVNEASASSVRPVISLGAYPEYPSLLVKLSKRLDGEVDLQEHKYQVTHQVWDPSPGKILVGWVGLAVSPVILVLGILSGKPGSAIETMKTFVIDAFGINDGRIRDTRGDAIVEITPVGKGTRDIPWPAGEVVVKIDDNPGIILHPNSSGEVTIDFLKLPLNLTRSTKDLQLKISADGGELHVEEHMTISLATVRAWPEKEAELARKEQGRKEQERLDVIAQKEQAQQVAREKASRAEERRRKGSLLDATGGLARVYVEGQKVEQFSRVLLDASIDSKSDTDSNLADYVVDIAVYPKELADSCKEGDITMRYVLHGPIYKNRKTGQVDNLRTQAIMSVASGLANMDGTEFHTSFRAENYRSAHSLRIEGSTYPVGCAPSPDINLVAVCPVTWKDAVILRCLE